MIRFSVVVPLYNKAAHIGETIASVLAQSYAPLEIIIVNDGSTDDGPAIVRAIASPLIKIIERGEPGPGGYAARNIGILAANGEWIAFLDADDLWEPDHLANLSATICKACAPVGGAFAGVNYVTGGVKRPYPVAMQIIRPNVILSLADIVRGWLASHDCPLWTGGVAFRRDVLIDAGLFPAGRALRGGDKDMWVRAAARTQLVFSPVRTANFLQDASNRLSDRTAHDDLPILVRTISELLRSAEPELQPLFRRLANREIGRYAKRNTKEGRPIPRVFFSAIYFPAGLGTLVYLAGLTMIRPIATRL